VASEELLEEYAEVLARPRLRLPTRYVRRYLAELRARATLVSPAAIPTGITHENDRHLLACAVGGRADVLVTGNLRHFPRHFRHTRILAPAQLLAELIAGGE
jgi:predicted nucleic acid-binding protein